MSGQRTSEQRISSHRGVQQASTASSSSYYGSSAKPSQSSMSAQWPYEPNNHNLPHQHQQQQQYYDEPVQQRHTLNYQQWTASYEQQEAQGFPPIPQFQQVPAMQYPVQEEFNTTPTYQNHPKGSSYSQPEISYYPPESTSAHYELPSRYPAFEPPPSTTLYTLGSSTSNHTTSQSRSPEASGPSQSVYPSSSGGVTQPATSAVQPAASAKAAFRSPETSRGAPATRATGKRARGGAAPPRGRKRARKGDTVRDESDSGSDEDQGSDSGYDDRAFDMAGPPPRGSVSRLPGACTHCKKLKMKCDFPKSENTCKRCQAGGHPCIVEGRKPRTIPNKREYLLAQIRQKDSIIESLLKQIHSPYTATPLSIDAYRAATSPSDENNHSIVSWLQRLQSQSASAAANNLTEGVDAFRLRAAKEEEEFGASGTESEDTLDEDDEEASDGNPHNLPDSATPLGLLAKMSLSGSKAKGTMKKAISVEGSEDLDDKVGVANEAYFTPGPATDLKIRASMIEQHNPPAILVHGLVSPQDVDRLFQIFYDRVNPFISLLDPVLHTPASTFARCPFLFTIVCALSSRYLTERSEIYPIAMHFAKHAAASALVDGWKSVELCQAYILMSIYALPARKWEEDRSWLYTGLAIRIATDLNLHQMSTATKFATPRLERESLNKTRVWMILWNLDKSTATQFGKPSTIKDDFYMRNAKEWYKKSPYNLNHDVHLCAYTALLRIVSNFHDEVFSDPNSPTGLNKSIDFRSVTLRHDSQVENYLTEWTQRFAETSDPDDATSAFRCTLLPYYSGYARLVMFSFGFQQAFERGIELGDQLFLTKCLEAAKLVVRNMNEVMAPSGYMRYSPDGHFIFASFASGFLLKLLRPEFSIFISKQDEGDIFDLIGRLIQTLSSPEVAIDEKHTPQLYARFLAGLLSRYRRRNATGGAGPSNPPPGQYGRSGNAPPPRDGGGSAGPSRPSHGSSSSHQQPHQQQQQQQYQQHQYSQQNIAASQSQHGSYQRVESYHASPEVAYPDGTGYNAEAPIEGYAYAPQPDYGSSGMDFGAGASPESTGSEEIATMRALKNPGWWDTMMMPGFSWPVEVDAGVPAQPYDPIAYSGGTPQIQMHASAVHGHGQSNRVAV